MGRSCMPKGRHKRLVHLLGSIRETRPMNRHIIIIIVHWGGGLYHHTTLNDYDDYDSVCQQQYGLMTYTWWNDTGGGLYSAVGSRYRLMVIMTMINWSEMSDSGTVHKNVCLLMRPKRTPGCKAKALQLVMTYWDGRRSTSLQSWYVKASSASRWQLVNAVLVRRRL